MLNEAIFALGEGLATATEIDEAMKLGANPVSYTHLRAHETVLDLVCRLLLEKKKHKNTKNRNQSAHASIIDQR